MKSARGGSGRETAEQPFFPAKDEPGRQPARGPPQEEPRVFTAGGLSLRVLCIGSRGGRRNKVISRGAPLKSPSSCPSPISSSPFRPLLGLSRSDFLPLSLPSPEGPRRFRHIDPRHLERGKKAGEEEADRRRRLHLPLHQHLGQLVVGRGVPNLEELLASALLCNSFTKELFKGISRCSGTKATFSKLVLYVNRATLLLLPASFFPVRDSLEN